MSFIFRLSINQIYLFALAFPEQKSTLANFITFFRCHAVLRYVVNIVFIPVKISDPQLWFSYFIVSIL